MTDSFWLWFIRPFAEMLGALALGLVIFIVCLIALWVLTRRPRGKR